MKVNLQKGEKVRHKAREEWGVGTVVAVESSGTVRVIFEDHKTVSIAKGADYLRKVVKD